MKKKNEIMYIFPNGTKSSLLAAPFIKIEGNKMERFPRKEQQFQTILLVVKNENFLIKSEQVGYATLKKSF